MHAMARNSRWRLKTGNAYYSACIYNQDAVSAIFQQKSSHSHILNLKIQFIAIFNMFKHRKHKMAAGGSKIKHTTRIGM